MAIEAIGRDLDIAFTAACDVGKVDLGRNDLTRAVLARLKSYYTAQEGIKTFLEKHYAAPAADFFVETVAFFLKVAITVRKLTLLEVKSEMTVARCRGAMRPDISVWKNNELVAAIECKTQLGWNRDKWRQDFMEREAGLKELLPNAKLFLLAMTERNWGGFGNDDRRGTQFFALLDQDHWPTDVDPSAPIIEGLVHPIEDLFSLIVR